MLKKLANLMLAWVVIAVLYVIYKLFCCIVQVTVMSFKNSFIKLGIKESVKHSIVSVKKAMEMNGINVKKLIKSALEFSLAMTGLIYALIVVSIILKVLIPPDLNVVVRNNLVFERLFLFALLIIIMTNIITHICGVQNSNIQKDNSKPENKQHTDKNSLFSKIVGLLFGATILAPFFIAVIVGFVWYYSLFIYTILPIEIGGGKAEPIKVMTQDSLLMEHFKNDNDEVVYLLDRTDKTYVLLIENHHGARVFQIPTDRVIIESQ
ncbi:hypothetical protein [Anoxynatronum buryatiense]|uniref:Uncharacterized protein n=1 Tax=Anoxynatronum buryatiense TaxID=489973 RepID=A0AA46AKN5_9CLOT|nr:hypothetical protein [Anoxynatronum buryatiense]SMP73198.1 hypothetical protein SAMN06296020_1432 [Anoxynatronum buryatiense]